MLKWMTKREVEDEYRISRRTTDRYLRKLRDSGEQGAERRVANRVEIRRDLIDKMLKGGEL